MPPRSHKILRYELPAPDALDIVIKAVQAIPAEVEQVDDQNGQVTAKTRQTLKSRGEHIRVQVEKLEKDEQCQVRIDSELMWILTELQHDWGVNAHNIEVFEKAMQQEVRKWKKARKAAPAPPPPAPAPPRSGAGGLEQLRCSACGAQLTRQAENHWICEYCGHEYIKKG